MHSAAADFPEAALTSNGAGIPGCTQAPFIVAGAYFCASTLCPLNRTDGKLHTRLTAFWIENPAHLGVDVYTLRRPSYAWAVPGKAPQKALIRIMFIRGAKRVIVSSAGTECEAVDSRFLLNGRAVVRKQMPEHSLPHVVRSSLWRCASKGRTRRNNEREHQNRPQS